MGGLLGAILNWLSGGIVKQFTDPLLEAYNAKLRAQNDEQELEAEKDIQRIEAARDIAVVEAGRRFSATSLGRWLVVVPFGLWWASIYLVQIVNGLFGSSWVIIDVPQKIHEMALVLVPAILIADAGTFAVRRFTSK